MVKNPPVNAGNTRDMGSIPGWGRSLRVGHDNLLQYSCLENSMVREAWWATVHRISKTRLSTPQHIDYDSNNYKVNQPKASWKQILSKMAKTDLKISRSQRRSFPTLWRSKLKIYVLIKIGIFHQALTRLLFSGFVVWLVSDEGIHWKHLYK